MHRRLISNLNRCCYLGFFCFHLIQDSLSPMFTCFWTGFVHDQIHSCWFHTGVMVRVFPLYSSSYFVPCATMAQQTRRTNKAEMLSEKWSFRPTIYPFNQPLKNGDKRGSMEDNAVKSTEIVIKYFSICCQRSPFSHRPTWKPMEKQPRSTNLRHMAFILGGQFLAPIRPLSFSGPKTIHFRRGFVSTIEKQREKNLS